MLSLESYDRCDSISTHNIPFSIYKMKATLNLSKIRSVKIFQVAKERVRNSIVNEQSAFEPMNGSFTLPDNM